MCVLNLSILNMQPKSSMNVSSPSRRSLHESGHEYNQRTVPPPADALYVDENVAHSPVSHQRSGSAPHVVAQTQEHGVYVEFVCSPTVKGATSTTDTLFMYPQPMQTIEQLLARQLQYVSRQCRSIAQSDQIYSVSGQHVLFAANRVGRAETKNLLVDGDACVWLVEIKAREPGGRKAVLRCRFEYAEQALHLKSVGARGKR